jgi:hypothetical protein
MKVTPNELIEIAVGLSREIENEREPIQRNLDNEKRENQALRAIVSELKTKLKEASNGNASTS